MTRLSAYELGFVQTFRHVYTFGATNLFNAESKRRMAILDIDVDADLEAVVNNGVNDALAALDDLCHTPSTCASHAA